MADSTNSYRHFLEVSDATAADTDIKGYTPTGGNSLGPCALIECVGGGNLTVKTQGGGTALATLTNLPAGALIPVQANFIDHATTTVVKLRIWWV